jgi:hypothetical protein
MYRRYTIHRDGDLLVEELDAQGKPIEPEPVPPEERLPVEVVLMAPDGAEAKAQLLDLLELCYSMEADPPSEPPPSPGGKGFKLNVLGS